MKHKLRGLFIALALLSGVHQTAAQGTTAFTYQGQLQDRGTNANGTYTMVFALYNADSGGSQIGSTITTSPTLVNGLFTVNLDFGSSAFTGSACWLNITVTEGATTQELSPRVQVLPAPYAIFANAANTASNLSGTLSAGQISGTILNSSLPTSPDFSGSVTANTFAGNGVNVSNVNAATIEGLSSSNFVTIDGLISSNFVQLGFDSGTGLNDIIAPKIRFASNVSILGTSILSSNQNVYGTSYAYGSSYFYSNVDFQGSSAFRTNVYFGGISTFSTNLQIDGISLFSTNAYYDEDVVFQNENDGSVVPWYVGIGLAASGKLSYPNSLTFSNGSGWQMALAPTGSQVEDDEGVLVPAAMALNGSLGIVTGNIAVGYGDVTLDDGNLIVKEGDETLKDGDIVVEGGDVDVTGDVDVDGDVYADNLEYSTIVEEKTITATTSLTSQGILSQLAGLPLSTWSSKRDSKTQHFGPKAQDFQTAFGLGKDGKAISLVDESGVALAAIQALNEQMKEKDAQIQALEKRLSSLEQSVKPSTRN